MTQIGNANAEKRESLEGLNLKQWTPIKEC